MGGKVKKGGITEENVSLYKMNSLDVIFISEYYNSSGIGCLH